MNPRPPSHAILVLGHTNQLRSPAAARLRSLGTLLLGSEDGWRVDILEPEVGDRQQPDRAGILRHLHSAEESPRHLVVISARVVMRDRGPALVTSPHWRDSPEEGTLLLDELASALTPPRSGASAVILHAAPHSEDIPSDIIHRALLTDRLSRLVISSHDLTCTVLDVVRLGLGGSAIDPITGEVTLRSLAHYVKRVTKAAMVSDPCEDQSLFRPPGLLNLWTLRTHSIPPGVASFDSNAETHRWLLENQQDSDLSQETDTSLTPVPGVTLPGHVRLEAIMGEGANGLVYQGLQVPIGREVAVKILRKPVSLDASEGHILLNEVVNVGRLRHPNVVQIYNADKTSDGRLFFVMELVRGRSLRTIINEEGPLEPERALEIAAQILDGLNAAHRAGLIHADIKPSNIVIEEPESEGAIRAVLLDFGMARLRDAAGETIAIGGTPDYMAPEQISYLRIDTRSDIFSVGLVLYEMLTGGLQRPSPDAPPRVNATRVPDADLRQILERALARDIAKRYASAQAFASDLGRRVNEAENQGAADDVDDMIGSSLPFRGLHPFEERDQGRFFGRDKAIEELGMWAVFRRFIIYAAPSGTGKSSLLEAGLIPRLRAIRTEPIYVSCRAGLPEALRRELGLEMDDESHEVSNAALIDRVRTLMAKHGRLALIIDHLERAVNDEGSASAFRALLGRLYQLATEEQSHISVVLCIREDFLARLLAVFDDRSPKVLRLGPLDRDGASQAIVGPLAEARVTIDDDVLERVLDDLQDAAAQIRTQMRWGDEDGIYPPHLQLTCEVLYRSLDATEARLTMSHYDSAGGVATVIGQHLERVLNDQFHGQDFRTARAVLLSLVTSSQLRQSRSIREIRAELSDHFEPGSIDVVLERLRRNGIVVPVHMEDDEVRWELIHDSLVERVQDWTTREDLDRRRAKERLRYHLHMSRQGQPSLLTYTEFREVLSQQGLLEEVEKETRRIAAPTDPRSAPWTPAALVQKSRRAIFRRWLTGLMIAAIAIWSIEWFILDLLRDEQRALDRGRVTLELAFFDWDPERHVSTPVDAGSLTEPEIAFYMSYPEVQEETRRADGMPYTLTRATAPERAGERLYRLGERRVRQRPSGPGVLALDLEIRRGTSYIAVRGRGRPGKDCPPSWLRLDDLPGWTEDETEPRRVALQIPTCTATEASLITIPAGAYIYQGPGSPGSIHETRHEQVIKLPTFAIQKYEVSNAAYRQFAAKSVDTTRRPVTIYPAGEDEITRAMNDPRAPASAVSWKNARAYCLFMGLDLPNTLQWQKAARGGLQLHDGRDNPHPRRNLPWGITRDPRAANHGGIENDDGTYSWTAPVGSFPRDRSPYGVMDMAGNVAEWILDADQNAEGHKVSHGGDYVVPEDQDMHFIFAENRRPAGTLLFNQGFRCAGPPVSHREDT